MTHQKTLCYACAKVTIFWEKLMSNLPYWIAFNRVPGVGPVRFRALLDFFEDDIQAAWEANASQLAGAGLDSRTVKSIIKHRPKINLDHEMALIEQHDVTVLTWHDPNYPNLLREIPAPPPVLYVRGELTSDDEWGVAIVGTRKMSAYGRRVTETLATGLAEAGLTIISGLALGVDGMAHHCALQAGGRTIAVLANGLDRPYPAKNRKMAEAIVAQQKGALISDYPIGTPPEAKNFPPRNRIISGLSLGVVIVEAAERSGALITARYAADQNRELMAVPGSIFSRTSKGTNKLIVDGATPAISVEAVLQALDIQMVEPQKVVRQIIATTPIEERVLKELNNEPLQIDKIGQRCGLTSAELSSTLALLELKGLVRQVGGMSYIRI
ncbi:MAG: DNA-processing protein DprA [Ardenticatenaceae bacterium]